MVTAALPGHADARPSDLDAGSIYAAPAPTEARAAVEKPQRTSFRRSPELRRAAFGSSGPATGGIIGMVTAAAERHGVPVGLAHAIIKIESGYNCRARSRYGAVGIGQVLPSSARAEGVSGNLSECGTGLEAAMRYLSHAVALYGAGCEAASAYNIGLAARGRCTGYGRRAMRLAQLFR
jgi:soluble lytic murein transglycosylase-like protein